MSDLFGNPDPLETSKGAPAIAVSLFDSAAERIAYEGGRNVAQVRSELVFGTIAHEVQTCRACGSAFFAKPREDSTCNLCRRKVEKPTSYEGPFPRKRHSHTCARCLRERGQGAVACYRAKCTKLQRSESCGACAR
jgi:hypothetical protein